MVDNNVMTSEPHLEPEQIEIQSVTKSGLPAKTRIQHLVAAKRLFDRELEDHKIDAVRRARLKGMINGNPPYNPQELEELGLGHMTNVNFLEMRAILDAKAASSFELIFEVPTLVECATKFSDPNQPTADYGRIVAEEFTKICMDWSGFLPFMDKTRREADAFGLGVGVFRDQWDWRPRAVNSGSFLTNKYAEVDVEKLPYAFVRDQTQIGELFRMALSDEEAAEKDGWRLKAVRSVMKRVFCKQQNKDSNGDTYQTSMWESIEQQIRNAQSPDYEAKQFELVDIVHLLVREIDDGKISHYIFAEGAEDTDDFLYVAERAYENMAEGIWILPYNNGDGYLHSVRGLASMVEAHCDLSNRFLGQVFDAGKMQSSLLIQPNGPTDVSQISLIRMGPVTVLPHDVKAVQSSFQPNVSQLVALRDLSSNVMKNNTGVFRQYSELAAEQQVEKTAYEVSQQVAREARAEKSSIAFDYEQVQKLYRQIFRRLTNPDYIRSKLDRPGLKEARKFVAACVQRGVPYDLLLAPDSFSVHATRAIGMGSWGVRMDLTNQILNMSGQMDEQGRRTAFRERIATLVGYRNVDKYMPVVNRDQIPSNEQSIAQLENNDLMEGSTAVVGSDQFHAIHFNTHAQLALEVLKMYQQTQGQGMEFQSTLRYLQQAVPHMEAHLQYIAMDPMRGDFVDQARQVIAQLVAFANLLEKAVASQAKQAQKQAKEQAALVQQAQQTVDSQETQVDLAKVDAKLRVDTLKVTSLNDMRRIKTEEQMDLRRNQQAQDNQLRRERQEAELELARQKQEAELELKATKRE